MGMENRQKAIPFGSLPKTPKNDSSIVVLVFEKIMKNKTKN
jgi:hypothetical protein